MQRPPGQAGEAIKAIEAKNIEAWGAWLEIQKTGGRGPRRAWLWEPVEVHRGIKRYHERRGQRAGVAEKGGGWNRTFERAL